MGKIIPDSETQKQLQHAADQMTVCDDHGRVLGWFIPAAVASSPPISAEEVEKRKKVTTGRTLQEILADLERRA